MERLRAIPPDNPCFMADVFEHWTGSSRYPKSGFIKTIACASHGWAIHYAFRAEFWYPKR